MRLLVSVADAEEARAALAGGADVIDVKDPREGSLGAPAPATLREIAAVVGDRPLSVALGDFPQLPHSAALAAVGAAACGATMVKIGLRGSQTVGDAVAMLIAVREALAPFPSVTVIAGGYADAARLADRPIAPDLLPRAAALAGVAGWLVDTAVKDGTGLLRLLSPERLVELAEASHALGLSFAVAGQLTADQLPVVAATGADVAGVRSAVCAGGDRTSRVSPELVAAAAERCHAVHV